MYWGSAESQHERADSGYREFYGLLSFLSCFDKDVFVLFRCVGADVNCAGREPNRR